MDQNYPITKLHKGCSVLIFSKQKGPEWKYLSYAKQKPPTDNTLMAILWYNF